MRSILNALQEGRLFELPSTDKADALEFLARILDANPDIEVGTDAIEAIQKREQECNTGLGLGVAVPHVRAKREEGELFCAIGWSQQGIDYGAADGEPVHLVFMYYIPGAQKNVYLKEVSVLVKAITKTGGIKPIAHSDNLNVVRNLLLDWVTAGLGETGPEAVARMIKLEVKQAQATPAMTGVSAIEAGAGSGRAIARVMTFSVLVAPPSAFVLTQDAVWGASMEKENHLGQRLAGGAPFMAAGRQVFVTSTAAYPGGRVLYQCVALAGAQ
jgi:mannitol/fructose-specific phosphotransferase system IIA component (Ntr-type)